MKVGISCYPTWGGSGVVASELAMALARRGDAVHVISYAIPSRLDLALPGIHFHEVHVADYPLFEYPPYSLALATKMVDVARHMELDILHAHYAVPNAVSAVLARQILHSQKLKVVTTLHGTDITLIGNNASYLETTRWSIDESDSVTTVSQFLADQTRDVLSVDREINVIPNFIDPARASLAHAAGATARRWAQDGEAILVHVSNFRPVKRAMDVVEVFKRIRRDFPARLLLVGDGPDRARIENDCRNCDLCDHITFVGNTSQVEEILVGADLFILPSESESFGLAALEALACGVPVIATRVGGLPEVVEDGVNGHLLPVGDVEAMTAAARGLLEDRERWSRFSKAARGMAIHRFEEEAVVDQYRLLYQKILKEPRAPCLKGGEVVLEGG